MSLERALSDALVRFLTQELKSYQRRIPNNLDNLKKHVQVGDVVIYSKYGGTEVKYSGEDYLVLSARDVLAIVEK